MFPCVYDPAQHEIINPPVLDFCRAQMDSQTEKNRLFIYHHRVHDTFVVARWASDRKMGVFTDFLNLGYSLGNFDRALADEFRKRLYRGLAPAEIGKALNRAASDFRSENEEKNDTMKSVLSRCGMDGKPKT